MESKAHNPNFTDLVQKVLNYQYGLDLKQNVRFLKPRYGEGFLVDFADSSKNYFVEVLKGINLNRGDFDSKIENIQKKISSSSIEKGYLIFIFEEYLSEDELMRFRDKFKSNSKLNIDFFDKQIIFNFAQNFNITVSKELFELDTHSDKSLDINRLPITDPIADLKVNVWWLNADEQHWEYVQRKVEYYPITTITKAGNEAQRRYFGQFKIGDLVITYQKSTNRHLFGIFMIIPSEMEHSFAFILVYEFENKINWQELNEIPEFSKSEIRKMSANGSAFKIENNLFVEILARATDINSFEKKLIQNISEIAKSFPDLEVKNPFSGQTVLAIAKKDFPTRSEAISLDHGDKDSLDFRKDVQSLAALIALKEMKPPLAIALFGKWGTGKSFFMNALEKRIRELSRFQGFRESNTDDFSNPSETKDDLFLRGIAHIKFNAWSYLDANLWAGLAHSLFEKLNLYITDHTKSDIERLKVQVKITKRLELLHSDLNNYEDKKKQLEKLKEQLQEERDHILLRFFSKKYDKAIKNFLESNGFDENDTELLKPSNLNRLIKKSIGLLTYLKANSYRVVINVITLIVCILVLKQIVVDVWNSIENPFWKILHSIWSSFTLTVVPILVVAQSFYRSKKKALASLSVLVSNEERIKSNATLDRDLELVGQQTKALNDLISEVEESIQEEYSNNTNLTQLAIANFVSTKPDQEDYKRHLGIITVIRKDFETLSALFVDLEKESYNTLNSKERARIDDLEKDKNAIEKAFNSSNSPKLQRIVLYIDDLDRCSDEKVLEVLQAVHLLMAFPLFTVVVGVDERSVHNALKFQQLKRYQNIDKTIIEDNIKEIEPREYLEKIFQIPFQLPEASETGITKLIDDLIIVSNEKTSNAMGDVIEMGDFEMADDLEEDYESIDIEVEALTDLHEQERFLYPELFPEAKSSIQPTEIKITTQEKKYLQLFAPIVGNNPRTIKRYINIFRIVKTHENDVFNSDDDTLKIVFLIAFLMGKNRSFAIQFFRSNEKRLNQFLHELKDEKELNIGTPLLDQIEALQKQDKRVADILGQTPSKYSELLRFVERFSYKLDTLN